MIQRLLGLTMMILLSITIGGCDRPGIREMLEPGVSASLAQYRKKQIRDVSYELYFSIPDELDQAVTGNVTIHFQLGTSSNGVILDFRGGAENIHHVEVNGNPEDHQYLNEHIIISSRHMVPGRNQVQIAFTSTDQALNRSEEFMYSLFVPDRASTAFPCFDQPDMKASFALRLEMPESWTGMANGPQTGSWYSNGRRTMEFAADKPISTYLFAFTAGKYQQESQTRQGRTISLLHRETDREKLEYNLPDIFNWHFQALGWMEEYTGIAYPFEKFDLAIIPGFQYSGMEHPGAIWYRDNRLLLDLQASLSQKLQKATLISHETAHMWFGNLVTMKWFDDVWLKEVFAGFMADKMVEPMFAGENHWLQFQLTHFPRAYAVDRTQGTHPIRQTLDNLNQAGTLYGAIIYNKAPIVFRQLERIMGEPPFQAAVREYLQEYSFGNADWDELVSFFDKHSEENITQWSQAWVYGEGMPRIGYQLQGQLLYFTAADDYSQKPYPSQWLELVLGEGFEKQAVQVLVQAPSFTHQTEGNHEAAMVLVTDGYGLFELRESDRQYLLQNSPQLESVNHRAAAHLLLWEDFLQGNTAPLLYLESLKNSLASEDNPLLLAYLLDNLQKVFWNFLDEGQRWQVSASLSGLLWNRMMQLPADQRSTFLRAYSGTALLDEDMERIIRVFRKEIQLKGYQVSEEDRFMLVANLCVRQHPIGMDLLDELRQQTSNPDRLRRMDYLRPVLSADLLQREAFFERLKDPANRRPEPWALEGLALFHHPLRAEHSRQFLPRTLQLTQEIQRTGDIFFPLRWLEAALAGYQDALARKMVNDYLENNPQLSPSLRLKVLQAAHLTGRSVEVMNRYREL